MHETENMAAIKQTDILEQQHDNIFILPLLLSQQRVLISHPTLYAERLTIEPMTALRRGNIAPEACAAFALAHQAGYLVKQERCILLSIFTDICRDGRYFLYCCALDDTQQKYPFASCRERYLTWIPVIDLLWCSHIACQLSYCLLKQVNII